MSSVALTLALACGSEPSNNASRVEPSAAAGGEKAQPAEGQWHHFWIITQARDAVIRGDLEETRALLERIAQGEVGEPLPFEWTVWVEEMQDEAARAERVKGRHELARIVSAIASRCGDCHRSTKGRHRTLALRSLEQRAHGRAGGEPAHADHAWAADELWLGMTIPQHQAWVRGSAALIESPLHAPPGAPEDEGEAGDAREAKAAPAGAELGAALGSNPAGVSQAPDDALQALSGVGKRLHAAGRPLMMARAYADLIQRCAACHAQSQAASSHAAAR